MFKVAKNSVPTTFYTIFQKIEQSIYNLRNTTEFHIPLLKTVYNGPACLSYLGRKAWNMLSLEYKKTEPLLEFKTKIKGWNPNRCPCRICKNYIFNVGYVLLLFSIIVIPRPANAEKKLMQRKPRNINRPQRYVPGELLSCISLAFSFSFSSFY